LGAVRGSDKNIPVMQLERKNDDIDDFVKSKNKPVFAQFLRKCILSNLIFYVKQL